MMEEEDCRNKEEKLFQPRLKNFKDKNELEKES